MCVLVGACIQLLFERSNGVWRIRGIMAGNGNGSYKTQLALSKGQKFLVTMFDNSGLGDVSELLTVGASTGSSCNTTDPGVQFNFELDIALQQCRVFTFNGYTTATLPVTILALIPGGNGIQLSPGKTVTSFDWIADVKTGTSMVFAMFDAKGNFGGTSDVRVVGATDDTSCLNSTSPSSTMQLSSTTSISTSASSSTSSSSSASASPSLSSGTVVAIVVGGLVGTISIVSLVAFFVFRRRGNSRDNKGQFIDLHEHDPSTTLLPQGLYQPDPFPLSTPTPAMYHHASISSTSLISPLPTLDNPRYAGTSLSSGTSRKASMMESSDQRREPSRFIIHTDAADELPDENGVIELPPQYSEVRRPIPGFSIPSDTHGTSSSTVLRPPPPS
ncbi:hypothetical protein EW146_g1075 [Bondarzewia mesenterica]|uniref:Uncharacterized protein n=1 Tax=Bondarzewia mesenterica TaxID=1095465 RepID=A0A4S4M6E3_9AGAM|nr:hypothetical protein EW146_g1075 [Bondarzewia mesenterica]